MTEKQIIKYLKEKELNIQSAPAALFACDLVFGAYTNSQKVHGVNFSPNFSYISYKYLNAYFQIISQKMIDKLAKKNFLDYCKNSKSLDSKIRKHKELEKKIAKTWQNYQKGLSDMLKTYQDFIRYSQKWWCYGAIGEDKSEIIIQEVAPRLAKRHNISLDEAKQIITIISHPKEQSIFNAERKDFLYICLYILKNKNLEDKKLKQKIDSYKKKYFWFKTNFYQTKKITSELLLKEVATEIKKGKSAILKESKDIDRNFKKINREKESLLAKLKISSKDKKDIHFSQLITSWFDQRKLGTMTQFYYIFSFLEDIAKRYNLKYRELTLYTVNEVEDLLVKDRKLSKRDLIKRAEGVFFVYENGKKPKAFYGKEGKKMFKIATHVEKQKEIKGQVACTGGAKEIKGKVRIIYNPAKDKFNKGEILVSSMTRIEFLPYMREAKAVITNEGGVTCHAAIVSRELNIPCIIGTKIATKVLKSGNKVRMDMAKGEVEII